MKDKYKILVAEEGKAMHNSMHGFAMHNSMHGLAMHNTMHGFARSAVIEKVARKFQASLLFLLKEYFQSGT